MSKPLSTETIWGLTASGLLLVVLAGGAYLYLVQAKTPDVAPTPQSYNIGVLGQMQSDTNNVFLKIVPLQDVPQSTGDSVKYQSGELGKTDLTKFE